MFDKDVILKSPRGAAQDPNLSEALRLVLGDPRRKRGVGSLVWIVLCLALVVAGLGVLWAWAYPTQKANPGFWQMTVVSLIFWLNISQGLVALSALLRVTHASWRYPMNRLLDMGSLFGLWSPLLLVMLVVSRQQIYVLGDHAYSDNVWRIGAPVLWDSLAVMTAFMAGWAQLFLTARPDFAVLRDRAVTGSKAGRFFGRMAGGWIGSDQQWRVLRRAEGILVIGILLTFVASQTIIGWDFQLAAARDWDSSIFPAQNSLSAMLGAVAMTVLVITVASRRLRGRGFFTEYHYDNLGKLMVGLALVWTYFRICDFITAWYGHTPAEWMVQMDRTAAFPVITGLMLFGCSFLPVFANLGSFFRKRPWSLCMTSAFLLLGLACQRFMDTTAALAPRFDLSLLVPGLPGVLVFVSLGAMFGLTYLLGAFYFPIMSWWGVSKGRTRIAERQMGNGIVTVIVEDPPVWET